MTMISRRSFITAITGAAGCAFASAADAAVLPKYGRPNIILCMADDQGWGDTAYNGHSHIKTPNLDDMAASGLRFDRFYSGAPVCSPTRGSCLTGRHPYRYGVFHANVGRMRSEELTLAEALRDKGYTTGHFGKWHLGTLTTEEKDANRGGPDFPEHYSPPWDNGFDVCFSTESKVPTWNPMVTPDPSSGDIGKRTPGEHFGTYYWTGPGTKATENLEGDDSRVIMDRALPFIRTAAENDQPFFAVIWFHSPHLPVIAGPEYYDMYEGLSEDERHFYGCVTALDEQVGRLRHELRELGIADNTMLWYTSDNGPEEKRVSPRASGSSGPFRGRKRSLFEGGLRVPAILEWPAVINEPRATGVPCSTSDYFPTIIDMLDHIPFNRPEPEDGISLMPLVTGDGMDSRPEPLGFESGKQVSLVDNRYKLISTDGGATFELYDLIDDPGEAADIARKRPRIVQAMRRTLMLWRRSCKESLAGKDYQ